MSATATNIGPKISVEGEAEYRRQMAQIIAQQKALAAELKATVSGFAADTAAQEKARASGAVLQKEISNLSQALKEQQGMLDKAVAKYGENSKQALSYKTAVYNTTAQINDLKKELDSAGDALDDTADAMDDAGKSGIKFGDIIKANVISDFVVDGIKELASTAKDLASSFVQAAADVRAETAQFSQTFGDLSDQATQAIQNVATTANTLPSLLKPAATSIYAFARSSGATTSEAMDLMSKSMQVAVDSAAYYDKTLGETTETLQSFLKGNFENDAALGVSATETTRNAEAMKLFNKEYNDLSEIQKQQTLLQMVIDAQELSGAMGQAAREADGWSNVQSNLNEAWRQFSATQGQAMLDALIPVIQEVTNLLVGLTDGSLTAGEALQQAFGFISEQAAQSVSQIPAALTGIGDIGGTILSGLAGFNLQFQEIVANIFQSLTQGIQSNFPQLMDTGLKAITNFTATLRENAGKVVDQGISLILSLAQGIADGLPSLIEQAPLIVSNIANIINDNAPKLMSAGLQLIVTLGQGIIQAIPTLLENIPQIVQAVYDVWQAMNWVQLGSSIVTSIANGVKSFAKSLGPSIKSLGDNIVATFKGIQWNQLGSQIVNGIINGVKSLASSVIPTIKSLGSSAINAFKNIDWRQLGNAVITGIINVITTSFSFGSGVIQAVIGLGRSIIQAFTSINWLQLGQQVVQGLINGIKGFASGVVDAALGVADGVVSAFTGAWEIHSPSHVSEGISANWMKGLVIGFKNNAGEVMETVDDIAAELETRFSAIQETLSTQQSIAQQAFDNWLAGDGQGASSADVAARQIESLTQQIQAQQSVLEAAQQAYSKMVELYGAGSAEALKYQKTLLEQAGAFEDLQGQLDDVKLDQLTADYDDLKTAMDDTAQRAKLDFALWQEGFADTATESEKLQRELASQTTQLDAQKQVVEEAKATYQKLVDTYGDASDEASSYRETLEKEINTYIDLKDEVNETTDALAESQNQLIQLQKQAETFFSSAKKLYSSVTSIGSAVSGLFDNLGQNNPFNFRPDNSETTANKLAVLNAQYAEAVTQVEQLTMAFNQSVATTGAASEQSQDLAKQLEDAESQADSLKDQVLELSEALEKPSFGDFLTWTGDVLNNILSLGSGFADVISAAQNFGSVLKGLPAIGNILSSLPDLGGALAGVGGSISGLLGSVGADLAGVVSSVGAATGSIGTVISGVASTAGSAIGSIGTALTGLAASGGPIGLAVAAVAALGSAFVLTAADGKTLGEKLTNIFNGIGKTIGKLISSAFNWGRDLIQGFVNGIASMVDTLFGWIGDIASGIASFLHFSKPDQGPLREYERWMPDMMQGMARGIQDNAYLLTDAARAAAYQMRDTLTVPLDVASAAVGGQTTRQAITFSFGDIVVNGSGVTDVDELADRVIDRMTLMMRRTEAAHGMV